MGRAGAGGGGGGSSSGHSSSRSSSGHRVSSGGGSRAGSRSGGSSGGNTYVNNNYYGGGGYHHHNRYYGRGRSYDGDGSSGLFASFIFILVVCIFVIVSKSMLSGVKIQSERAREKLTDVPSFTSNCVTDELGWFDTVSTAGKKLKHFYDKTGIQPYVYLREYDASLINDEMKDAKAHQMFDQLGLGENAMLFVYFAEENTDEDVGYMVMVRGKRVDSIMDDNATDIYWAYIDKYWYSDLSTDELFQKAYSGTGNAIMKKSKTFVDVIFVGIILCIVIVVPIAIIKVMVTKRKHEKEKAEETERLIKADLHDSGTL